MYHFVKLLHHNNTLAVLFAEIPKTVKFLKYQNSKMTDIKDHKIVHLVSYLVSYILF